MLTKEGMNPKGTGWEVYIWREGRNTVWFSYNFKNKQKTTMDFFEKKETKLVDLMEIGEEVKYAQKTIYKILKKS